MKSGDKIFRAVVLTGLGLVTVAAETVSCGGGGHEGPDGSGTQDASPDMNKQKVDGDLIGDDASDSSTDDASDATTGGKDGFPMEGPPMN